MLAETCINTKLFRLQPEYMGTRRIRVTVCNVPANLPGEVVASYPSAFSRVEEMTQLRAMVVVERRRPRCWSCKQVSHMAKVCPQKTADLAQQPRKVGNTPQKTNNPTEATEVNQKTTQDAPSDNIEETSEEWKRVTRKRRKKKEEEPSKVPTTPPEVKKLYHLLTV